MRQPLAVPACLALLLLTCGPAAARAPQMRDTNPAAEAIMDGRDLQFVVRFDAPIDHAASRLWIVQDGREVRALHALLDSAPDVLFAASGPLPSGRYTLRWHVGAPFGGEVADGEIAFSVRP